ncbi:hypothetical protein PT2222_50019 [Paraburkholderia tropica]
MKKSARLPVAQRLARYRKKDALLDSLLSGDLTTGDGARNDQWLVTLLMYRCFSLAEIAEIMTPYAYGDTALRASLGPRYWLALRRRILSEPVRPSLPNLTPEKEPSA